VGIEMLVMAILVGQADADIDRVIAAAEWRRTHRSIT
jgi:hypothetical protein